MNVILYGRPEELSDVEAALKAVDGFGIVSVVEHFPFVREHLAQPPAEMILLDADNDSVSWQYLVGKFRKINTYVKIVLLSRDADDAAKAFDAGVFDFLLKPVDKKQLERVAVKFKIQGESEVHSKKERQGEFYEEVQ